MTNNCNKIDKEFNVNVMCVVYERLSVQFAFITLVMDFLNTILQVCSDIVIIAYTDGFKSNRSTLSHQHRRCNMCTYVYN